METDQTHSITVTRTRDDYMLFLRQTRKITRNLRIYMLVSYIVLILAVTNGMDLLLRKHKLPNNEWVYFGLYFSVFFAGVLMMLRLFRPALKRAALNENQGFLRKRKVTITASGFREVTDVSDGYVAWQGVDRIEKTKSFLLVFVDRLSAYCIPLSNFETPATADEFYKNMLAYWHAAHGRQEQLKHV